MTRRPTTPTTTPLVPLGLLVAAVALVAVNLRPAAVSIGPVLQELQTGLGMSPAIAGVLTSLPGIVFCLAGFAAVAFARRTGLITALLLAMALLAAALLTRVLVGSAVLFLVLSALALACMGVGNVLAPPVIKRYAGARLASVTTVYTVGLGVGSALPVYAAGPILASGGPSSWRWGLGLWAAVAAAAVVVWLLLRVRTGADQGIPRRPGGLPIHRSRTAMALCVFFGLQSMNAYVQFGWLAQMYRDAGVAAGTAAALVGTVAVFNIPGGLLMPAVAGRQAWVVPAGLTVASCMLLGWTGMLLSPAQPVWLWMLLLGMGQMSFPLALALITRRAGSTETTARLSGFAQPVGYLLAAAGPLVMGLLRQATGGWTVPLLLLMASAAGLIAATLLLRSGSTVEEELARA